MEDLDAIVQQDSKGFSVKPKSTDVKQFNAEMEENVKTCLVEISNVFASPDSAESSVKHVSKCKTFYL